MPLGAAVIFKRYLIVFIRGNWKQTLHCSFATGRVHLSLNEQRERECLRFVFNARDYHSKADFEQEMVTLLHENEVEFIVLAGYMRLIGTTLLKEYKGRIVNIHPSLLPAFPGKDALGQALAAGVSTTGVTVHFVDEGMDTGPIIAQEEVTLQIEETTESLQEKIHEVEHRLYPSVLQKLLAQGGITYGEKTSIN